MFGEGGNEGGAVGNIAEADARELQSAAEEVEVCVDEAGHDASAAGVEIFRMCLRLRGSVLLQAVADGDEPAGLDSKGVGGWVRGIAGPDFGVVDDEVGVGMRLGAAGQEQEAVAESDEE